MPPKARGGKRGRGRPPGASRAPDDAPSPSAQQLDPEDDEIVTSPRAAKLGGASPPKKPGRKPQGAGPPTTATSDDLASTEGPKKRKRRAAPSTSEEQPDTEAQRQNDPEELEGEGGKPQRRGRPPRPAQAPSADDGPKDGAKKRKRGTTSTADAQQQGDRHGNEQGELDDRAPASKRRRGRSSLSEVPIGQAQNQNQEPDPRPRKRGRPPAQSNTDQTDASQKTNKKKGRPRKSDVPEAEASPPPEPKQQGRRKKPDAVEAGPSQGDAPDDDPKPRRRSRRSDSAEPEPASGADEPPARQPKKPPFRYLAAKERKIPISVISEKWEPLNKPSADLARKLVRQAEVPVLQALAPGPRRDAAAQILRVASERLGKKISRGLPFPPASKASVKAAARRNARQDRGHAAAAADGRELELDFEAVALETEALEKRLDPLLHSIEVLRAEEKRMGDVVERERKVLEELRQNARGELAVWKEKLRKSSHPLLPDKWDPDEEGGHRLALAPAREPVPSEWLFTNLPKGELPGLANQLMSHLTSIRNNVEPADAVHRAMTDSEAALRRVLAGVLDSRSYEAAIMPKRETEG